MRPTDTFGRAAENPLDALRGTEWHAPLHRERLAQALARAFDRAQGERPARRLSLALLAALGLGGAAFAGVELFARWNVKTNVSGTAVGTREVVTDSAGRGVFRVPVEGLDTDRFQFEREGSDAEWVHFDIEVVDGVAEVRVQEFDDYPIDPASARAVFAEAAASARADAGALWGVALESPLLVIDPTTRFCVLNRADEDGWARPVDDVEGVHVVRMPASVGCGNTTVTWAGVQWTMLLWPLPSDPTERLQLLMHESFHRAQVGLGLYRGGKPCAHLDDFDGRFWLRLEARALAAALADDGDERRAAFADALLFRAQRRALDERAAESEDLLERLEGTAEYTGVRLASAQASDRRRRAAAALAGLPARPTLGRSFAYLTGPAYGLLLDELDASRMTWRAELVLGATFDELAARALDWQRPTSAADLSSAAWERAARHGRDGIESEELTRQAARDARRVVLLANFVDGPVLVLPSLTPNYSYDPNRIEALGEHGSVYGSLTLRDTWGTLEAHAGALMGADGVVRVPAPSESDGPQLTGDGWTLELASGWALEAGTRPGDFVLRGRED